MDPRLDPVLHRTPAWLEADGPDMDVVVASRVRLARNLLGVPFPSHLDEERAQELCEQARERVSSPFHNGLVLDAKDVGDFDAEFLIERSLASRDLFEGHLPALVMFRGDGAIGLMVNEEDHFRAQGFASGLDLDRAWRRCNTVTHEIGRRFSIARHPRYGYLTCCPTNAGSGMRASLMLHLPALARDRGPLQKALQAARRSGLAVRGVHGEGSRALGHLYQISNQRTLGPSEREQVGQIVQFGRDIARYERDVRKRLHDDTGKRRELIETAQGAWRALSDSEHLSSAQALQALSTLRLAVLCELGDQIECDPPLHAHTLLELSFQLQPGHLQARFGAAMTPEQRDASRAQVLRKGLGIRTG